VIATVYAVSREMSLENTSAVALTTSMRDGAVALAVLENDADVLAARPIFCLTSSSSLQRKLAVSAMVGDFVCQVTDIHLGPRLA
jgi:hypothetical protein